MINKSQICKQIDFETSEYHHYCAVLKEEPRFHRKQWEYVYIVKSLYERGLLKAGNKGLGFAVGLEPLPSVFTSFGCEVVATDLNVVEGTEKGWNNGQLCTSLMALNDRSICNQADFIKLCSYQEVNMNEIPSHLRGFDFNWSSCSFEHLGSIQNGLDFLVNQLDTLKPGGWAVHTTEYNISSDTETMETDSCVIYRQKDILKVVKKLRELGHFVEDLDFSLGWLPYDYKIDHPPYTSHEHIKLKLDKYVCTSVGIIIQKKLTC